MAVCSVHLALVSVNLMDEPLGYQPPVGPEVKFVVRYNQRDAYQPAVFDYANFGPKWTSDWIAYLKDNPSNSLADVDYYVMGGGDRTFTGFNTNNQTFAFQQYDQTLLRRTSPTSYKMTFPDGSKLIFAQPTSSLGTSRRVFLSQVVDPSGNVVTLTYDTEFRLVAITDAIGQVTTLSYDLAGDDLKITKVTDPFGRFATFDYDTHGRLIKITDVIGLTSQFTYIDTPITDTMQTLVTPYGTNTFLVSPEGGDTRFAEITYPDGSRERVEFNQSNSVPAIDSITSVPVGMSTFDDHLAFRNTFYWSRTACALGYGDYSKARLFHWLHTEDINSASGALESTKEPLEGRVWYDYAGQSAAYQIGTITRPAHMGRVLDDGTTQLYTYGYNGFGKVRSIIDPVGRTFSYIYATNGIDLLEVRQTRGANNELLFKATYNAQHLPLTKTDAAGQTTTFTYNTRGQVLTVTDAKNETTTVTYDTNGYVIMVDGPLPGTNDAVYVSYDAFGRTLTRTDTDGYAITLDYDSLDRFTRVTHPDGTFEQYVYDRLDPAVIQDRAGRQTLIEHDRMRQISKRTDPLGRPTLFQWCSCGDLKSLTDPLGHTTTWTKDVQGRLSSKQYGDGSQVIYQYEKLSGRVQQIVDENQQVTQFAYNRDNTLRTVTYLNAGVPTPPVSYTYDPDYRRVVSMTDGVGTTAYSYFPVTTPPLLGALRLASVDGPLANDTITYGYDELGRRVLTAINGVGRATTFDAAGRLLGETNALGSFAYSYQGSSSRLVGLSFPNGQAASFSYGDILHDFSLQQLSYAVGATPISQFGYGVDSPAERIRAWSQQPGGQLASTSAFSYDAANQLLSAVTTNSGGLVGSFAFGYDLAGNRLSEVANGATNSATYNGLNQLSTAGALGIVRTNEWDAEHRLTAVNAGNQRTELTYDGLDRLAAIRELTNGFQVSLRRFLWCDNELCEERDATGGTVTKRYFRQGMKVEGGPLAGAYCYSRDHLGSVRELTDGSGNVRARYSYDPFGRKAKVSGDVEADFGFAGMFWTSEAGLSLTRFRAYDANLGRWLARDPLPKAETLQGPNLYFYAGNNPISVVDPLGLCCEQEKHKVDSAKDMASGAQNGWDAEAFEVCESAKKLDPQHASLICEAMTERYVHKSEKYENMIVDRTLDYQQCIKQCERDCNFQTGVTILLNIFFPDIPPGYASATAQAPTYYNTLLHSMGYK
jgi:RHS repeat-associated protein